MFHVSTIKKLFKLRVSDYNKIVEYLNNLCGGLGINIKRPDSPSASNPPIVEIDREHLANLIKEFSRPSTSQNPTSLTSGFHAGTAVPDQSSANFDGTGNGVKIKACTRICDDGRDYTFCFREFVISPDGRVLSVGAESFS